MKGAGEKTKPSKAHVQTKARTRGTGHCRPQEELARQARGRCSQRPHSPLLVAAGLPYRSRAPRLREWGLMPGQPPITAQVPGSPGSPRPSAASILPAWLRCSFWFPIALVGKPPGSAQARLVQKLTATDDNKQGPSCGPRTGTGRRQLMPHLPEQSLGPLGFDCRRSQKLEAGGSGKGTLLLSRRVLRLAETLHRSLIE